MSKSKTVEALEAFQRKTNGFNFKYGCDANLDKETEELSTQEVGYLIKTVNDLEAIVEAANSTIRQIKSNF